MAFELRIVKGARQGATEEFSKSVVSIGRHPMCDLRFDANQDLDVSAKHAEIRVLDDRYVLHDLGSTNGTFVNGRRITTHELRDGDTVVFGTNGPTVSFHASGSPGTATGAASTETSPTAAPPRRPTEVRIAEAVQQQTGRLRRVVAGLGLFVAVAIGVAFWVAQRASAESRAQIARLLAANDSLARSLEQRLAQTDMADSALKAARAESEELAEQLRAHRSGSGDISALSAAVRSAQVRTATLARMDYAAVTAMNRAAIVFIAVEMQDGELNSGTGFNVLPSGLIVTNRHVVQGADGVKARRIAVVFDGMEGAWRTAQVESVSGTDELAFLRLSGRGGLPVVSGISRDAISDSSLGEAVAILGYPLGTSTAGMNGNINRLRPVATLGLGTVSKVLDETLQLEAYAAPGSSGSPVFDARGLIVGVVYGGAAESNGRIVYAVPSHRLAEQLPKDAAQALR